MYATISDAIIKISYFEKTDEDFKVKRFLKSALLEVGCIVAIPLSIVETALLGIAKIFSLLFLGDCDAIHNRFAASIVVLAVASIGSIKNIFSEIVLENESTNIQNAIKNLISYRYSFIIDLE